MGSGIEQYTKQSLSTHFLENTLGNKKSHLKIYIQGMPDSQNNFEKEQNCKSHPFDFKLL